MWTVLCLWILVCVKGALFIGEQRDGSSRGEGYLCVGEGGIVVVCIYARALIMVGSVEVYD